MLKNCAEFAVLWLENMSIMEPELAFLAEDFLEDPFKAITTNSFAVQMQIKVKISKLLIFFLVSFWLLFSQTLANVQLDLHKI